MLKKHGKNDGKHWKKDDFLSNVIIRKYKIKAQERKHF